MKYLYAFSTTLILYAVRVRPMHEQLISSSALFQKYTYYHLLSIFLCS